LTEIWDSSTRVLSCENCTSITLDITFQKDVPLRIRLIGIRYSLDDGEKTIEPGSKDFKLTESWLRRAYPVGRVISSQLVTNANSAWPFDCNAVNAQIAAFRALDVGGGTDARTHYYGMVYDNGNENHFMRGCAAGIPSTADPSTVASGPAGKGSLPWDDDGSYADWYTAHELAHTFGRKHPGACGETEDDLDYPYSDGSISRDNQFIGWDFGDEAQGLKMKALRGSSWHDVMTYCDYQWVGYYTYLGIRQRLLEEETLAVAGPIADMRSLSEGENVVASGRGRDLFTRAADPTPVPYSSASGRDCSDCGPSIGDYERSSLEAKSEARSELREEPFVSVIGTVNLTRGTGKILYVNAVLKGIVSTGDASGSPAVIRLKGSDDTSAAEIPVKVKIDTERNAAGEVTGLIEALIPLSKGAGTMELVLHGVPVDARRFGASEPQVDGVQLDTKVERSSGFSIFRRDLKGPTFLKWDGRDPDGDVVQYSVQRSVDLGKTWETLAVGLRTPELILDQDPRESETGMMFRIVASDGLNSTYTTTTEVIKKR
jgi:hypothetical protein